MKLSLVSTGTEPAGRFLEHVKLAELLGFHAFFHSDKRWAREAFSRLGAATQCTTRLGLGIHMTDPNTRHPALLAQAAATLAEMAPGRFRVIMRSGGDFSTLPGYGSLSPLSGLHEAFELAQRLWRGETVTLDGEVVKFKHGSLSWKPTTIPQIYIASRDPQILKLAGGIADGVMIDGLATPIGVEYAKRHISPGLQDAGRDWKDIALCCSIPVSVLERADDPVPEAIARAASPPFASNQKELTEMVGKAALDSADSRGIIDGFALVGTGAQIVERLKALQAAGIQEVVISPFLAQGQDTEDFMYRLAKEVLPQVSAQAARVF
jgi:5,10-methylenetetrahydromethanopterin reductase